MSKHNRKAIRKVVKKMQASTKPAKSKKNVNVEVMKQRFSHITSNPSDVDAIERYAEQMANALKVKNGEQPRLRNLAKEQAKEALDFAKSLNSAVLQSLHFKLKKISEAK